VPARLLRITSATPRCGRISFSSERPEKSVISSGQYAVAVGRWLTPSSRMSLTTPTTSRQRPCG